MRTSYWIRLGLLVLSVCGTSGWAYADPSADLLQAVQGALGPDSLPPAPTAEERAALLRVLGEQHPICPDDAGHAEWTAERFRAIADVPVAVGATDALASLALVDGRLSGTERSIIIEYLATQRTAPANLRVLQITRAASAMAVVLVPAHVEPDLRPLVARSNAIDLWNAALRGAQSSGNVALVSALEIED